MEGWTGNLVRQLAQRIQITEWLVKELAQLPKKTRKLKAALMIYAAWNIWKERNRRVFNQKYGTPQEVLQEVNREVNDRKQACGARVIGLI